MSNPSDPDIRHYQHALVQSKALVAKLETYQTLPQRGKTIQQLEGCYELMDSILRANGLSHRIPNSRTHS